MTRGSGTAAIGADDYPRQLRLRRTDFGLVYDASQRLVILFGGLGTEVGLPTSIRLLRSYAMVLGPIVSFIALLWTPPWRRKFLATSLRYVKTEEPARCGLFSQI